MKIFVAIYEHRHGSDIRAFRTAAQAEAWRTDIANDWWEQEFAEPKPADPEATAAAYWDRIEDEFFNYEETELEG